MSEQREPVLGLAHVALNVADLPAMEEFYVGLMGMRVEWRPDPDNVYLTSGRDNLALHRAPNGRATGGPQALDHIGFFLADVGQVDRWCRHLQAHGVTIKTQPRTHRDGARSFYCLDPDGNTVQVIFHPPVVRSGD